MIKADETHFFCVVQAYERLGGKSIVFLKWNNLRFELIKKYKWYFEYRAALVKIQFPKSYVDLRTGHHKPDKVRQGHMLKNRLRAKKGKLTEYNNKLENIKQKHNSLFPVESDPRWPVVVAKLQRLKEELTAATKEFEQFKKNNPNLIL